MRFIYYLIIALTLFSCDWYEIGTLHTQEIENSANLIYHYRAGSNYTDSYKVGYEILDKNEYFDIDEVERKSFRILSKLPTKDTIFVIGYKEGENSVPKYHSTEFENYKGMIVQTDYYQYNQSNSINYTYQFSNFKETKDSLFIYGIEGKYLSIFGNKNEIGFYKGNIELIEDKTGMVKQIEIHKFLVRKYDNSILDYQIIINESTQVNKLVYLTFEPKEKINQDSFSNIGIYKKRKVTK